MFEPESYIAQYRQLQHGPARLRAMKEAIKAADEAGDAVWRFRFRDRYISESIFESDDVDAMVMFPEMLALYDSTPELQEDPDNRHRLMWDFKNVLGNAHEFTHIPLTQIHMMFDEFRNRCEQYGYSLRIYYYLLEKLADTTANPLPEEEIGKYLTMPEDDLKDCPACEADHRVAMALRYGHPDEAKKLSEPIFSGEIHCADVPECTYGSWIRYDLKTGDYAHARTAAKRLYPLLRNRMDLLDEIGTLLLFYAETDRTLGINIFRKELHNYLSCRNHRMKFAFAAGAYHLFRSMESPELHMVLPQDFPLFSAEHCYQTAALRDFFRSEARPLAEAFDRRNGNSAMSDRLEETYPAYDSTAADLVHADAEPSLSALAAVCKQLPASLTAEDVRAAIEQDGRFRVELFSQSDENPGVLGLHIAAGSEDGADIYQVILTVREVPPADDFRPASPVPRQLKEEIEASEGVILAVMPFADKQPDLALHFQIRLLHILAPDAVAYLDLSRLKVLPAGWVKLASESDVPPLVDYLYTLRLSGNEQENGIWITTAGLRCCGLRELEIWDADKENYGKYADLLCYIAERTLIRQQLPDAGEPFPAVRREGGETLRCTWLPASQAAAEYPEADSGCLPVRTEFLGEEAADAAGNAVLFAFDGEAADGSLRHSRLRLTAEDFEQFRYGSYIISDRKTAALAQERYGIFRDLFARAPEEAYACVRIGGGDDAEEIWMQLKAVTEDGLTGILTAESAAGPEGTEYTAQKGQVTDFSMQLAGLRIRPNTAYLALEL